MATIGAVTSHRRRHPAARLAAAVAGVAVLTVMPLAGPLVAPVATGQAGAATTGASPDTTGWTVYHGDPAGSGVPADPVTSVDTASRAWTSPALDGHLYGEPLIAAGRVYAATEDDTVYALSASTGAVVWSTHLGTPVPASALPCGNIDPTVGITGTPVLDQTRGELFVVADEDIGGQPAHRLVGLSATSGAIELNVDVDPPGASPAALLQRTGLNLDDGRVIFGFGGNYGDCASYRGRVVAVPETGGSPTFFTVDGADGQSQGAIWMGGAAPEVDTVGHVWVEVGNGSVDSSSQPYDDSDSVLELSPGLSLLQYFAPSDWPANNSEDLDMSTAPALLADGQVVIAGKSRIAYLLDGSHLGGIGGQEASRSGLCSQDIDGGTAVVGDLVYLPCQAGIVALRVGQSPASLTVAWDSSVGGGPPIVAGGLVWTMGLDGRLFGLDAATGAIRQQASIGVPANHFPTPAVGDSLLLAPSSDRIVALTASTAATPTTSPTSSVPTSTTPPTSTATTSGAPRQVATTGGHAPVVVATVVILVVLVVLAAIVVARRRRSG
jgi:outer membrane protein assembly factor BamB